MLLPWSLKSDGITVMSLLWTHFLVFGLMNAAAFLTCWLDWFSTKSATHSATYLLWIFSLEYKTKKTNPTVDITPLSSSSLGSPSSFPSLQSPLQTCVVPFSDHHHFPFSLPATCELWTFIFSLLLMLMMIFLWLTLWLFLMLPLLMMMFMIMVMGLRYFSSILLFLSVPSVFSSSSWPKTGLIRRPGTTFVRIFPGFGCGSFRRGCWSFTPSATSKTWTMLDS